MALREHCRQMFCDIDIMNTTLERLYESFSDEDKDAWSCFIVVFLDCIIVCLRRAIAFCNIRLGKL